MKRKALFGTVALALGVTTLIINPRAIINDDTAVLLSCTSRQFLLINRKDPDPEEYNVPNGFYTAESMTNMLYVQAEQRMETSMAGNMFAYLAQGLLTRLKPAFLNYTNYAVDNACAFKRTTFDMDELSFN